MGNVGFLSLSLFVISGCSQTLWYGSGSTASSKIPQNLGGTIMSANISKVLTIVTTGRCEILWQAFSLAYSISFSIFNLPATRPLMGREAMCFIERSATSSYFTKEGGRRVGGHNTRGNIYNVENKGIYKVSGRMELTDKTNSRFRLFHQVEAALSKCSNVARHDRHSWNGLQPAFDGRAVGTFLGNLRQRRRTVNGNYQISV